MGIDSLRSLIANVPDWLRRLDELNGQIEQRQLDLAKYEESQQPKTTATRSLRRTNSTESLKPKDDGAAFPSPDPHTDATPPLDLQNIAQSQGGDQPQQNGTAKGGSPKSTSSTIQRQTKEAITAAQRRARAVVRKRQKTDSVISMEDGTIKYRSRIMIIVYYDSYVQSFFEELVKFVSASRNLMRKAKMAAKVAEIKRLAELEMPDDDEDDGGGFRPGDGMIAADPRFTRPREEGMDELRPRYPTTQQMGLMSRNLPPSVLRRQIPRPGMAGASSLSGGLGMFNEKGDIYDDLDKGLDFVQSMCEKAAHQFLRDGDCADEVEKIKDRLSKTKELADNEMERINKEDPKALEEPEPTKIRSYRPTSMRRDTGAFIPSTKFPSTNSGFLEIDDEGVQDMDNFQSTFKSPRLIS